jgi:hypothetical protein
VAALKMPTMLVFGDADAVRTALASSVTPFLSAAK